MNWVVFVHPVRNCNAVKKNRQGDDNRKTMKLAAMYFSWYTSQSLKWYIEDTYFFTAAHSLDIYIALHTCYIIFKH